MDLISKEFLEHKLLEGIVAGTELRLRNGRTVRIEDFASDIQNVERGFSMDSAVSTTLLGTPCSLGYTTTIEVGVSNLHTVEVGRLQSFYLTSGEVIRAEHLHVGDELMGITPVMLDHLVKGAEVVQSYMCNGYFRVTSIKESPIIKQVYSLTSPRHGRFTLANGLVVKAIARTKKEES
jgi:hypothetical protein